MDRLNFEQRDVKNNILVDIKNINNTLVKCLPDVPFINITDHFVHRVFDRGCSSEIKVILQRLLKYKLCEYLYMCYNDSIRRFVIKDGSYYLFVTKYFNECGNCSSLKISTIVLKPKDYNYVDAVVKYYLNVLNII